ncbi:MAG: carbonic anhydrase [Actinomycetota bacterium]
MSEVPGLLRANEAFAAAFDGRELARPPRRSLAVLTCIDARLQPERFLGLEIGDAHVLRNAGARVSDDVIRSLQISTWLMGAREILVIHHTDCGLAGTTDAAIAADVRAAGGPDLSEVPFLAFPDPERCLREDVDRIRGLGDRLPRGVRASGYLYDVVTGALREVVPA